MKILHISGDYPYTTVYSSIQEAMVRKGMDSYMFVPLKKSSCYSSDNERVLVSNCFNEFDRLQFGCKQRKVYKALQNTVKKVIPDILHAHFLFSAGYACCNIKQAFGIPYIVAVRNTDVNFFLKYFFWLRKTALNIMFHSSRIIFISSAYHDTVINHYVPPQYREEIEAKCVIIPNGIGDHWMSSLGRKKSLNSNVIRLVFAGSIDKNKNLTGTIKACRLLISTGYHVEYTVIGKMKSKSVFGFLSKNDFVHYVTPQPPESLREIYKAQDIFIMPSIHETFGLVYAEAMSQGLPVIYTKGQGFDGQFPEGLVGYHVDPKDPKDIAEKILQIVKNYSQISKQCVDYCTKFDWTSIAGQYQDIYDQVLNGKK